MKSSLLMRAAMLMAVLGAGGAFAQTSQTLAPGAPDVGPVTPVTDVGPAPAQERDSIGAIVLDNSLVRAQRKAFGSRNASLRSDTFGRGVMHISAAARAKADRAQAREEEAIVLYQQGAGSIVAP
jgi:hypothetical protein